MKINRLLEIAIILMNKGSVTAKELADRFEVSTRTIYRDIDVLSGAGVPVFTNKGNGGGISLLEGYSLNKTIISERESESLLIALQTLQSTKFPDIDIVLDKIGAVFRKANSTDWAHIDFSPWTNSPNEYNKFNDIKKAILERKIITYDYINAEGNKSFRSIEPMKLIYKSQAWYLWGYCKVKEDFRLFRISRIKNVIVTNEEFVRRKPSDDVKSKEIQEPPQMMKLKLKFYPQALHRLYDDFDDSLITRNADGTFGVVVTLPADEWTYGFILSFGCYVEVLEPKEIREIIAGRMEKALDYYA